MNKLFSVQRTETTIESKDKEKEALLTDHIAQTFGSLPLEDSKRQVGMLQKMATHIYNHSSSSRTNICISPQLIPISRNEHTNVHLIERS